jgi:solute carrier family 25 carnitine/acylcarnitine transporter 20/29
MRPAARALLADALLAGAGAVGVAADVARHVLRHEGGPLGLFKGLTATLWRESLGNMAMFGVYELLKQQMVVTRGLASTQQLSHSDLLLAGGLGGTAFWLGCYPLGECSTEPLVLAA